MAEYTGAETKVETLSFRFTIEEVQVLAALVGATEASEQRTHSLHVAFHDALEAHGIERFRFAVPDLVTLHEMDL